MGISLLSLSHDSLKAALEPSRIFYSEVHRSYTPLPALFFLVVFSSQKPVRSVLSPSHRSRRALPPHIWLIAAPQSSAAPLIAQPPPHSSMAALFI